MIFVPEIRDLNKMTYFHEEMELVHRRKTKEQAENREKYSNVEKSQLWLVTTLWLGSNMCPLKIFLKNSQPIKEIIFLSFRQKKLEIIKSRKIRLQKWLIQKVSDTETWLAWYCSENENIITFANTVSTVDDEIWNLALFGRHWG